MSEEINNYHGQCRPNFTHIIIPNHTEETIPLLNGTEENYFQPVDVIFAALLTIILTLSVLCGLYLIIEGGYCLIYFLLI